MEDLSNFKKPEPAILEISELEKPIKDIILKLKDKIDKGEYGLLIGDDASGRIPALIMLGFMRKIYESRKLGKIDLKFIPGGISDSEESVKRIQSMTASMDPSKKILIATEFVGYGKALKNLLKILTSVGFEVDVATIGSYQEGDDFNVVTDLRRRNNLHNYKIVSGDYTNTAGTDTPLIYRQNHISGVYKIKGELISRSNKKKIANSVHGLIPNQTQSYVNKSRNDINILVNKLFEWYSYKQARSVVEPT